MTEYFSEDHYREKLRKAINTQQSIQTLSHSMLYNRKYATNMIQIWVKEFHAGASAQQLVYLYIANDVMQGCLRKFGPMYVQSFQPYLRGCMERIYSNGDEKVVRSVKRLLQVWRDRKVMEEDVLKELEASLNGGNDARPNPTLGKRRSSLEPIEQPSGHVDPSLQAPLTPLDTPSNEKNPIDEWELLKDMPPLDESKQIKELSSLAEAFDNATISVDLMSDQLVKLNAALISFGMARQKYISGEKKLDDETEISWDDLDPYLFDVDVQNAQSMVEECRQLLDDQQKCHENLWEVLDGLAPQKTIQEDSVQLTEAIVVLSDLALIVKLAVREEAKQRNEQMLLMQKQLAEARSQSEQRHYQTHEPTRHLPVDYTKRPRTDTYESQQAADRFLSSLNDEYAQPPRTQDHGKSSAPLLEFSSHGHSRSSFNTHHQARYSSPRGRHRGRR